MKSYVVWSALSVLGLAIIHYTVTFAQLPLYAEFASISVFGVAGVFAFATWAR